MTRTHLFFATLLSLTLAADAQAQFIPVFGLPVLVQGGIDFHIGGRRWSVDGFVPLGNPYAALLPVTQTPFGFRQVGPAYPYYYGYPVYGSVDRSLIVQIINPPALAPPRLSLAANRGQADLSGIDLDLESPEKIWGKKPGLAKANPAAPAQEKKGQIAANQPKPPAPPQLPKLEEPLPEGKRLLDLGVAAFKNGEFGLALLRFRQADEAIPAGPRAEFYQGQAYIAMGKYREAAEILQEALRNQPNWPRTGFRPRKELYGDQDAAWKEHRNRLEQAQLRQPKDADLLFLLGYVAWFDGQRDTAVDYFTQSKALAVNPRWTDLFLKVVAKN